MKLLKISNFFKKKNQISNTSKNVISKNIEWIEVVESNSSKYIQIVTSQNQDYNNFINIISETITFALYLTDIGRLKNIKFNKNIKRFIIHNGHCRPKSNFKKM